MRGGVFSAGAQPGRWGLCQFASFSWQGWHEGFGGECAHGSCGRWLGGTRGAYRGRELSGAFAGLPASGCAGRGRAQCPAGLGEVSAGGAGLRGFRRSEAGRGAGPLFARGCAGERGAGREAEAFRGRAPGHPDGLCVGLTEVALRG